MADNTLYRDIKVALADLREGHEDMDFYRPGVKLIAGYRNDGKEELPAIELYRENEKTPFKTWYIVTDAYNQLSDVLERVASQVETAIEKLRRPL